MTPFERAALAIRPMPPDQITDIYACACHMTRDRLIEVVRQVCLSHARLQADFDGLETMYNAMEARSE